MIILKLILNKFNFLYFFEEKLKLNFKGFYFLLPDNNFLYFFLEKIDLNYFLIEIIKLKKIKIREILTTDSTKISKKEILNLKLNLKNEKKYIYNLKCNLIYG